MDEPNPIKPKKRWYQYRLKTLFVLPVVVGLLLVLYLYWDDWRKHRPPYQQYNREPYDYAYERFVHELRAGRLDHAYDLTSGRFKKQMTLDQFQSLVGKYPLVQRGRKAGGLNQRFYLFPMRNWVEYGLNVRGPDENITQLCVWVVMDDSFFYRHPPKPQVEEVQIREISEAEWKSGVTPPLKPSWEQK